MSFKNFQEAQERLAQDIRLSEAVAAVRMRNEQGTDAAAAGTLKISRPLSYLNRPVLMGIDFANGPDQTYCVKFHPDGTITSGPVPVPEESIPAIVRTVSDARMQEVADRAEIRGAIHARRQELEAQESEGERAMKAARAMSR